MSGSRFVVTHGSHSHAVEVEERPDGWFHVRVDGDGVDVDARGPDGGAYSLLIEGRSYLVDVTEAGGELLVAVGGETHRLRLEDPRRRQARAAVDAPAGPRRLVAPMPGKVIAVHVTVGQPVVAGAPLVALEAMKMENELRAAAAGTVTEVGVTVGQAVNAGDLLVVIA